MSIFEVERGGEQDPQRLSDNHLEYLNCTLNINISYNLETIEVILSLYLTGDTFINVWQGIMFKEWLPVLSHRYAKRKITLT